MKLSKEGALIITVLLLAFIGIAAQTLVNVSWQVTGLLAIANGGTGTATTDANKVFMGPASGSAAAPSFRIPSSWEFSALPSTGAGRVTLIWETGTTSTLLGDVITVSGTATRAVATSTLPSYLQMATNTTNGNAATYVGNKNYVAGRGLRYMVYASQNSTGAQRMWISLSDQTGATMAASDDPAGNYVGVHYCNDGAASDCSVDNTNWFLCTKDNTTQNCVNSNVAADTNFHTFNLVENVGTSWDLYIDGTLRATSSSNLPTATTPLAIVETVTCRTCTPTAQNFRSSREQVLVTASPY